MQGHSQAPLLPSNLQWPPLRQYGQLNGVHGADVVNALIGGGEITFFIELNKKIFIIKKIFIFFLFKEKF